MMMVEEEGITFLEYGNTNGLGQDHRYWAPKSYTVALGIGLSDSYKVIA